MKTVFVNLYFVANPDGSWVLIDTGVPGSATKIKQAAEEIFGKDNRPQAILLTHGHFDHTGAAKELAEEWKAPIYAHPLELPYLTGLSSYPPPDSSVGGGAMAYMAFTYPKKPINLKDKIKVLPNDGSVPGLQGWRWLHTPGHSPGHVSFYKDEDRTLIVGDAFCTCHAESAISVFSNKREVHGPPAYFTPDWGSAHHSVEKLNDLNPEVAASGHGMPMRGSELKSQLDRLVHDFWMVAVPKHGRYVHEPAVMDESGVVSVPPPVSNPVPKVLAVAGAVAAAGLAWAAFSNRKNSSQQKHASQNRPYSHNRVMQGTPPGIDPNQDDPQAHTNNYP
ncbi:MBL fold metallo-hydrolase [Pontibacter oryzae]|uniref:MBL fold metallo-hydrolase n=1 Tax=Pontibacter oryzae TaxID=2304593 RepID=A0A399SJ24_9BACT|nr:MBL fold metallo-hydrolase [Pontibacter oryzae]